MPECVGACTCAQHVFQELQRAQQRSEQTCVSLVKDDTQLLHYRKKWGERKNQVWESQPMFDFSVGPIDTSF